MPGFKQRNPENTSDQYYEPHSRYCGTIINNLKLMYIIHRRPKFFDFVDDDPSVKDPQDMMICRKNVKDTFPYIHDCTPCFMYKTAKISLDMVIANQQYKYEPDFIEQKIYFSQTEYASYAGINDCWTFIAKLHGLDDLNWSDFRSRRF